MRPDTHYGGLAAHHKASPKAFARSSWLKSRQSVVEDENKKLPIGLGKNNFHFVSKKSGFGQRPEVVVVVVPTTTTTTTTAPLEAEMERGPQKYSIQTGSISIVAPRALFRYNSEMPNKSMRFANNVPSQQGKSKALQHSKFPLKRNISKSEYKAAFGGVLNTGSKTSLQGHTSDNEKYHFGGLTGLPFRTSTSGPLEGANASDTHTTGNYILKPPTNGTLPFKVASEKALSLRQGSLQGGSAVHRIGTRASQAKEMATPSLTQSSPDDEERSLKSTPVTDNRFPNRMLATSNAILVRQSPSRYGERTILRGHVIPSAFKTRTHLPSQSVPRPFGGKVRNVIGATVSLSSETRQLENHPGLTRNVMGPNDLEVVSGNAKFPPKHVALAPIIVTNTQSYRGLGKPYSPVFRFPGFHFSRPQLEPMVTPIDTIHTRPGPIKSDYINYPRPSRTMVQGRRVKAKGVKKPDLLKKMLHADILGSTWFTSAKSASQDGSKRMADVNKNAIRTKPKAESFSSSPREGNSASYPMIYRRAPKRGVAGRSREHAGRGGGRVQFSSVRDAFPAYWSGKAARPGNGPTRSAGSHRKVLSVLRPVAKGQSGNFVDVSPSNFASTAADEEEWNYLKTSASNASFKSAKVPRSVEATQT